MSSGLPKKPGYIKLHRSLQNNWIWSEKPYGKGQAWIDLLMEANFADVKKLIGDEIKTFKRGQVYKSQLELSHRWGWSRKKVARFLDVLEMDGMLSVNATTKGTIITIENYELYQSDGTTDEHQKNNAGTSKEQRRNNAGTQDKKDKKDKKERRKEDSSESLVERFHDFCPSLPKISELTKARKYALEELLKKYGVEGVESVFTKAEQSDFLTGEVSGFIATFDWLIDPDNFIKVLEGSYDNRERPRNQHADIYEEWANEHR